MGNVSFRVSPGKIKQKRTDQPKGSEELKAFRVTEGLLPRVPVIYRREWSAKAERNREPREEKAHLGVGVVAQIVAISG